MTLTPRIRLACEFTVALTLTVVSVRLLSIMIAGNPLWSDFAPLWAAGRAAIQNPSQIYDFAFITAAQPPHILAMHLGTRPFAYPPTALMFLSPFALLPFRAACVAWELSGAALYLWGGRRLGAPWWVMVLPPVLYVYACGQVGYWTGGLIMLGLTSRERPALAGLCFAVAGAIKPQLLLFLPLALVSSRDWRTFAWTGAFAIAELLLAAVLFGLEQPVAWLRAMPEFADMITHTPWLLADTITPTGWLLQHGLDERWAWLAAPPAALLVWRTFRGSDPALQLAALVGAALLVSPYAMNYELAVFAPTATAMFRNADARRMMAAVALTFMVGVGFTFGLVCLLVMLVPPILAGVPGRSRPNAAVLTVGAGGA